LSRRIGFLLLPTISRWLQLHVVVEFPKDGPAARYFRPTLLVLALICLKETSSNTRPMRALNCVGCIRSKLAT
jgi:hypothetical protein